MKNKLHQKYKNNKKIQEFEKKFENLPKSLQLLILLYLTVITIFIGIVIGIAINKQSIKELNTTQSEKIRFEQNTINNILKK